MDFYNNSSQRQQVDVSIIIGLATMIMAPRGSIIAGARNARKKSKSLWENEEVDTKTREFL